MTVVYWIIGGAVLLFILLGVIGQKESENIGKQISGIILDIENSYTAFVEKSIALGIVDRDSLEIKTEDIKSDALKLLKPELDQLITIINTTNYEDVSINDSGEIFPKLTNAVSSAFKQSEKNETKKLTDTQIQDIYDAFTADIVTDLDKRTVLLKTGI